MSNPRLFAILAAIFGYILLCAIIPEDIGTYDNNKNETQSTFKWRFTIKKNKDTTAPIEETNHTEAIQQISLEVTTTQNTDIDQNTQPPQEIPVSESKQ